MGELKWDEDVNGAIVQIKNKEYCRSLEEYRGKCMKKRKTVCYIFIAFVMIILAGCGYTKEEKADMKRYEIQGRENAKNYIKEKYGMDAKIREMASLTQNRWRMHIQLRRTHERYMCISR